MTLRGHYRQPLLIFHGRAGSPLTTTNNSERNRHVLRMDDEATMSNHNATRSRDLAVKCGQRKEVVIVERRKEIQQQTVCLFL